MAKSGSTAAGAITLEQLVALNDEIAALVRARVPLERSLGHLGGDLPGRLGRITQMVAERMRRGESLSQILQQERELFPPVYRAVVLAGVRAGRLPGALESVSRSARRLSETRRMVAAGFLYPLVVVLLVWGLFVLFVTRVSPVLLDFIGGFDAPGQGLLALFTRWGESAQYWGPAGPVVICSLAVFWWFCSGRATLLETRSSVLFLGWLPGLGAMVRLYRFAAFAEVLALLVEHEVPLSESIVTSAEATGDRRIVRAARRIAEELEHGRPLEQGAGQGRGFPPLLNWLMTAGQRRGALLPALRHAAETYRRRARRKADAARVLLPIVLTFFVGGTAVLFYALMLFAPWTQALQAMSR